MLFADWEMLKKTWDWATEQVDVQPLAQFFKHAQGTPLISVGSGGSYTLAALATLLHQSQGCWAKHVTPLELSTSLNCIPNSSIFLPSASGKNTDINIACRQLLLHNPHAVLAMCSAVNSPLAQQVYEAADAAAFEFEIPTGHDGFLANVSLLAFAVLMAQAAELAYPTRWNRPSWLQLSAPAQALQYPPEMLQTRFTWMVLYGSWGLPVALDAESKFTESAMLNVRCIDYRNFSHGHFHWLAHHTQDTGVIAFITPQEEALAEATLRHLPPDIPQVILQTTQTGPWASSSLLLQLLALVDQFADALHWHPQHMVMPEFVRPLKSLPYDTSASVSS